MIEKKKWMNYSLWTFSNRFLRHFLCLSLVSQTAHNSVHWLICCWAESELISQNCTKITWEFKILLHPPPHLMVIVFDAGLRESIFTATKNDTIFNLSVQLKKKVSEINRKRGTKCKGETHYITRWTELLSFTITAIFCSLTSQSFVKHNSPSH